MVIFDYIPRTKRSRITKVHNSLTYIGGGQIQTLGPRGFEGASNGMITRDIQEEDVGALVRALESESGFVDKREGTCTRRVGNYEVTVYLSQEEELRKQLQNKFPELYHQHTTQRREE